VWKIDCWKISDRFKQRKVLFYLKVNLRFCDQIASSCRPTTFLTHQRKWDPSWNCDSCGRSKRKENLCWGKNRYFPFRRVAGERISLNRATKCHRQTMAKLTATITWVASSSLPLTTITALSSRRDRQHADARRTARATFRNNSAPSRLCLKIHARWLARKTTWAARHHRDMIATWRAEAGHNLAMKRTLRAAFRHHRQRRTTIALWWESPAFRDRNIVWWSSNNNEQCHPTPWQVPCPAAHGKFSTLISCLVASDQQFNFFQVSQQHVRSLSRDAKSWTLPGEQHADGIEWEHLHNVLVVNCSHSR